MIQYSFLGRTAASNQFCLRMGTELVPDTLYSNELTRLCARENYIKFSIIYSKSCFSVLDKIVFLSLIQFMNCRMIVVYLKVLW
jgi:hypothetical protein